MHSSRQPQLNHPIGLISGWFSQDCCQESERDQSQHTISHHEAMVKWSSNQSGNKWIQRTVFLAEYLKTLVLFDLAFLGPSFQQRWWPDVPLRCGHRFSFMCYITRGEWQKPIHLDHGEDGVRKPLDSTMFTYVCACIPMLSIRASTQNQLFNKLYFDVMFLLKAKLSFFRLDEDIYN